MFISSDNYDKKSCDSLSLSLSLSLKTIAIPTIIRI